MYVVHVLTEKNQDTSVLIYGCVYVEYKNVSRL